MRSKGPQTATAIATIQLKRAYEPAEAGDGVRVLVDRLWARGVAKDVAHLDAWMKELGPTTELRKWFGHRPDRWDGFVERYRHELATPLSQLLLTELQGIAGDSALTLIYGAHDPKENEAVVLRHELLHERIRSADIWDPEDTLLVTAGALAAAHHDAVAPAVDLKRFASPVLSAPEIDRALTDLLTGGTLRKAAVGWQVTSSGIQRLRQLSRKRETT